MHWFFCFVKAFRHLIPLGWAAVAGWGLQVSLDKNGFFDNLADNMESLPTSPSNVSARLFDSDGFGYFDSGVAFLQYTDAFTCPRGGCDISSDPYAATWATATNPPSAFPNYQHYSYFSLNGTQQQLMAPYLLSEDGRSMMVAFPGYWGCDEWTDGLTERVQRANTNTAHYFAGFTGRDVMDCRNSDAAKDDLSRMDIVSVPLALLVLAWRVQSLPLMVIAVLVLPTSLLVSLLVLGYTSRHIAYPNFSPALFISSSVAVVFDWSLFMLSRYKEGVLAGRDNDTCVRDVVMYSGHTVVVSGITLAVAFLSLAAFPVEFLQAVGKGAALTLLSCMLVSVTLTPALLLLFPCFFRANLASCCCCRKGVGGTLGCVAGCTRTCARRCCLLVRCRRTQGSDDSSVALLNAHALLPVLEPGVLQDENPAVVASPSQGRGCMPAAPPGAQDAVAAARKKQQLSIWFRLASYVADNSAKVLLIVLLVMSPLSYLSTKLQVTVDQNQLHDRTQPEYETWLRFRGSMASGLCWPYPLIAQPAENATLADAAEVVEINNALIAELVTVLGIEPRLFSGPTWLNGRPLGLLSALGYMGYPQPALPFEDTPLYYYSQLRNVRVSHFSGTKAFYTEIDTPFDPQGWKVEAFVSCEVAS